jgi:8-oxo-dGTP diphosphatase
MRQEISAGGIVASKRENNWHILLLKDMHDNWTFPKGIIERGEDPQGAAVREIREETGATGLTFIAALPTVSYTFNRDEPIQKQVHYFVFTYNGTEQLKPQVEEGISEVIWATFSHAKKLIGYPKTNESLLAAAERILSTL